MRALMKLGPGPGEMAVSELARPAPEPDEVVVRVSACGICGTDLSLFHGSPSLVAEMRPSFPLILGHEFAGEVVDRGTAVSTLRAGQWVAVNPHLYCGVCSACARGQEEICSNRPIISFHRPGGAAEYVAVRERNAYPLPGAAAEAVGALGEPLAVAVHAVERVTPGPADRVSIVGAGPIGILIGVACQEAGCRSILISGLKEDVLRMRIAEGVGISTAVAGPQLEEEAQRVGGFDVVFEAAGAAESLATGLRLLRPGGRLSVLGIPPKPVPVDVANMVLAEKSITGTRGYTPKTWTRVTDLLSQRKDDLMTLVTHRLPLESYAEAMALLEAREGGKIFLVPGSG